MFCLKTFIHLSLLLFLLSGCGNPAHNDENNNIDDLPDRVTIYVSINGDDDRGIGSKSKPYRTIDYAVSKVKTGDGSVRINISEGTYTTDEIYIYTDISLYGGYSHDFSIRDSQNYVTTINSNCGFISEHVIAASCYTIRLVSSRYENRVFDGIVVNGGGGARSYAISATGGLTISNSIINGGSGSTSSMAVGVGDSTKLIKNVINGGASTRESIGLIIGSDSSALIKNNRIDGGSGVNNSYAIITNLAGSTQITGNSINGGTGRHSVGIYNSDLPSTALIAGNKITGGTGLTSTTGIANISSSPIIINNTIEGGNGSYSSKGVSNSSSSSPNIINNIIFGLSAIDYSIYENSDGSDPINIANNVFYNSTTIYSDHDLATDFTNMCSGNPGNGDCSITLDTPVGANNVLISGTDDVVADLGFESVTDWHLTVDSPISITEGGSSTGEIFTDKDGNPRTVPWSIGAYEYD